MNRCEETDITLGSFEWEDAVKIWKWRGLSPEAWRTPWSITLVDHRRWYEDKVCGDRMRGRYFGVFHKNLGFIGQTELTGIDWYNRSAEIGMIIDPDRRHSGVGCAALRKTLDYGFVVLGLHRIWGEVFHCNGARAFWERMVEKHTSKGVFNYPYNYSASMRIEEDTRLFEGKYYDSTRFQFVTRRG